VVRLQIFEASTCKTALNISFEQQFKTISSSMLIIFYQPELKKKLAKGIIHKIVNDVLSGENKKKVL